MISRVELALEIISGIVDEEIVILDPLLYKILGFRGDEELTVRDVKKRAVSILNEAINGKHE